MCLCGGGRGEGSCTVRVFACEAFVMLASADFCLSKEHQSVEHTLLYAKVCLLQLPNYVIIKKSGKKAVEWHYRSPRTLLGLTCIT